MLRLSNVRMKTPGFANLGIEVYEKAMKEGELRYLDVAQNLSIPI